MNDKEKIIDLLDSVPDSKMADVLAAVQEASDLSDSEDKPVKPQTIGEIIEEIKKELAEANGLCDPVLKIRYRADGNVLRWISYIEGKPTPVISNGTRITMAGTVIWMPASKLLAMLEEIAEICGYDASSKSLYCDIEEHWGLIDKSVHPVPPKRRKKRFPIGCLLMLLILALIAAVILQLTGAVDFIGLIKR